MQVSRLTGADSIDYVSLNAHYRSWWVRSGHEAVAAAVIENCHRPSVENPQSEGRLTIRLREFAASQADLAVPIINCDQHARCRRQRRRALAVDADFDSRHAAIEGEWNV